MPNAAGRFVLSETPVETVAPINRIVVVDGAGETVREYGTGDILYAGAAAPGPGEVRLNPATGELTLRRGREGGAR